MILQRVVGAMHCANTIPEQAGGVVQRDSLEWRGLATVRLLDGDSGVVLLSERFEQDLDEILVLERQIAEELTRFLSLPMFRRERRWLGSDPTTLLEAYRFNSRGRVRRRPRTALAWTSRPTVQLN